MFDSQEKLFKTSKCDNCYYYEKHNLGMDGTMDICYAQNRKEFLGGVILNRNYKNNIKCDKYKSCKQHYKEINKKLKIYEELEQQLGINLEDLFKELIDIKNNLGEVDSDINPDYLAYEVSNGITYGKLSKELGCDLDVVFKALKEGILVDNKKIWLPTVALTKIKIGDSWGFDCHSLVVDLKDYQKTWWLASDKKEKDKQ